MAGKVVRWHCGVMPVLCRSMIVLLALLLAMPASAQDARTGPTPRGVWLHANRRIEIEIVPCGELLCGTLVWFKWPNDAQGIPLVDLKNPDPALRSRGPLGLTILSDLRRTSDNSWAEGHIYNPDYGKTYNALMSIQDDSTLRVRAYVLIPLFGETQIWSRMTAGVTTPENLPN